MPELILARGIPGLEVVRCLLHCEWCKASVTVQIALCQHESVAWEQPCPICGKKPLRSMGEGADAMGGDDA